MISSFAATADVVVITRDVPVVLLVAVPIEPLEMIAPKDVEAIPSSNKKVHKNINPFDVFISLPPLLKLKDTISINHNYLFCLLSFNFIGWII